MSQNLKLPICPKCNDTKHVRKLKTIKLTIDSERYECKKCNIQWGACGISEADRKPQRKPNEYEINEVLRDYGFVEAQERLCQLCGFVYGGIYLIGYIDPNYPCDCRCHHPVDGQTIRHIMACWDKSFEPTPSRLFGVYNGRNGAYLLFNTGKHEYQVPINDRFGWIIR